MFNQLIASSPKRRGFWTMGTISTSLGIHLLLLGGAVYASTRVPELLEEEEEEEVTFMEIEEEEAPEPIAEVEPPPQGFQELIPPINPPSVIPDIQESQVPFNLDDFSGLGVARSIAVAPVDTVDEGPGFVYQEAVLDTRPALANGTEASQAIARLYPRMLLNAGIGGTVMLRFIIEADGRVDASTVEVVDAPHDQLAAASRQAIATFRFTPGRYRGEDLRVVVQMPITWQAGG